MGSFCLQPSCWHSVSLSPPPTLSKCKPLTHPLFLYFSYLSGLVIPPCRTNPLSSYHTSWMFTISPPQYLWFLLLITCPQEPLFGLLLSLNCRNSSLLAIILHELTNSLGALSVLSYISCGPRTQHSSWGLLCSKCSGAISWTDFVAFVIVTRPFWLPESVISHHWLHTSFSGQLPVTHLLFSPFPLPLPCPTLPFIFFLIHLWATVQRFSEESSCFLYLFSHTY